MYLQNVCNNHQVWVIMLLLRLDATASRTPTKETSFSCYFLVMIITLPEKHNKFMKNLGNGLSQQILHS